MKKIIKFILKQFIKCFIFIFVSAICFYCCSHVKAFADYTRDSGITFNYGTTEGFHVSNIILVPENALYLRINDITANLSIDRLQYSYGSQIYTGSYSSTVTISNGSEIDVSAYNGQNFRIRVWSARGNSVNNSIISSSDISFVFSGSDPDLGVKSQEQRYNTTTFYSADFTKSNSLPLIYSGSLFLSDFTPNGNCNSVQVDASTVGGDQLEWRLNLGQSGIDGQTAWLPIGFKMPLQVNQFDEHSIQLRMKDPDDPTQYYDLDPSELSICSVTYGYMTDVYFSLPPGEEQNVDTTDFGLQVPTMDYSAGDAAQVDGLAQYILAVGECTSAIISFSGMSAFIMLALVITVAYFFLT